jgi:hypothetical protein
MRQLHGAAVAAALAFLTLSAPALAEGDVKPQPAAAGQNPDDGWRGVVYPIYGWLPIYGADTRLPDVPGESSISSSLNQAFLAAFRVEKGRFALEGGYLYAGLSGEAERPIMKLEVDTNIADLRAGFEVVPDLFLEGGVRWLALDMQATVADYPAASWKPDMLEPVVGFTYRPLVGKHWRFVLHGDVGGLVTGDSTTATGSVKLEWQPVKHLLFVAGGTVMYLSTEGTIGPKSVKLDQTLYGPIIGFGIPF